jgi:hypothetical protein
MTSYGAILALLAAFPENFLADLYLEKLSSGLLEDKSFEFL